MLSNGTIALLTDTSVPGVSWESDNFRVFDNDTVLDKATGTLHKGQFINVIFFKKVLDTDTLLCAKKISNPACL